jgi:hypothetical protein
MVLQGSKGNTRAEIKTALAPNVNDTMVLYGMSVFCRFKLTHTILLQLAH